MSVTISPAFGSVALDETNDITIERWRDDGGVRSAVSQVPRADSFVRTPGKLAMRYVSLEGIVGPDGASSPSRDSLRTAADALMGALLSQGWAQLKKEADRFCYAELDSFTLGDDEGLDYLLFTARFKCDPYVYAATADSDAWSSPTNGATRALSNGGTAPANPAFTITIGSTGTLAMTLSNTTSGKSFTLAGSVTSGDVLIVDADAQTLTLNGDNALSMMTAGDFFGLAAGSNTLSLALSGVSLTSIATAFTKRWY